MNASAPLQESLTSPRCGFMQLAMLPYMAWGQKCWMSAWHSFATHAALDSLAEQPTESSLMCDSMHARMRPSPGAMPAHRDLRSTAKTATGRAAPRRPPSWSLTAAASRPARTSVTYLSCFPPFLPASSGAAGLLLSRRCSRRRRSGENPTPAPNLIPRKRPGFGPPGSP